MDDKGQEVKIGAEGDIAIKVKPHRPVGLFTGYIVRAIPEQNST